MVDMICGYSRVFGASCTTNPATPVLLMHLNGTNGSTTFTDSSPSAHTITPVASAQISTAQSVFGGASGYFGTTTSDSVTLDGSSDFAFGTGDLTIDFRFRVTSIAVYSVFYTGFITTEVAPLIYIDPTSGGTFKVDSKAGSNLITGATVSTNTWYHGAFTRASGTSKLFLDGTQTGSSASDSNNYVAAANAPMIGNYPALTLNTAGWIDELRVLKGTAAWTSNFTPPTSAYCNS